MIAAALQNAWNLIFKNAECVSVPQCSGGWLLITDILKISAHGKLKFGIVC